MNRFLLSAIVSSARCGSWRKRAALLVARAELVVANQQPAKLPVGLEPPAQVRRDKAQRDDPELVLKQMRRGRQVRPVQSGAPGTATAGQAPGAGRAGNRKWPCESKSRDGA
jgi:hypothetical protein